MSLSELTHSQVVHPFLSSVIDILQAKTGLDIKHGSPFLKHTKPPQNGELLAVFNVSSPQFTAVVTLCIMKAALRGMLMVNTDTVLKSEAEELIAIAKQIVSVATPLLDQKFETKTLVVPSLLQGQGVNMKIVSNAPTVVIPLTSHRGDFFIEIVAEKLSGA